MANIHSWAAPNARSRRLVNTVGLLLALFWLLLLSGTLDPRTDDFKQYWQAAVNLRATGDPFVAPSGQEASAYAGYYYPPLFAYLIQPVALLSQHAAQLLWFWLNAGATLAYAWLCVRLSGSELARRYWGVVLLVFCAAPPTRLNLQLGQIGVLSALLLVGWMALVPRRPARSGWLLALASLIRIYPALLGLILLLQRRWRAALGAVGAALGLLGVSLLVYGPGPYLSFVQLVLAENNYYPFAAEHNISWYGLFSRLLGESRYTAAPAARLPWLIAPLTALGSVTTLALCLWRARAASIGQAGTFALGAWFCALMLCSSTNGYYSLVLLLLPTLAVLGFLEQTPKRAVFVALGLCLALLAVPPGWTTGLPTLYLFAHTGWGLLLLTPACYGLLGLFALLLWLAGRPQQV